jgi:hypothetical protein
MRDVCEGLLGVWWFLNRSAGLIPQENRKELLVSWSAAIQPLIEKAWAVWTSEARGPGGLTLRAEVLSAAAARTEITFTRP